VVDIHPITVSQDPAELPRYIRGVTAAFLASGIDPKQHIVLFSRAKSSLHRVAKILPGARGTIFRVLFPHVGHISRPGANRHHRRLDTIGNSAYLIEPS
jgi:hypothetical protein